MAATGFLSASFCRRFGLRVSFFALLCWSFCFSFSQVAGPRYLSVCLFTCLGGLLVWISGGGSLVTPHKSETRTLWLLFLLGLLPLSDGLFGRIGPATWSALQLHIPMLALPFVLVQLRGQWPFFWKKMLFLALLSGLLISQLWYLMQGPVFIWESLRNDQEFLLSGWLNRPYFGFLGGLMILISAQFCLRSLPWLFYPVLLFQVFFLILIASKLSLLALFVVFMVAFYLACFKSSLVRFGLPLLVFCGFSFGLYQFFNSVIWSEIQQFGSIRFETLPKFLVNSLNTRLALWQASFQLLADGHWLFGLGSHQFQHLLDQKLQAINSYVAGQHLNPHNVMLYLMLQYGLPGLFILLLFFGHIFKVSLQQKNSGKVLLVLFWFSAMQTEVLYDRELGVHAWVWLVLVFFLKDGSDEIPRSQATAPFFSC